MIKLFFILLFFFLSGRRPDAPRCRSVSAAGTVSGVSKQETASLDCQVDADPSNDVHFWWTFLGTPLKSMLFTKVFLLFVAAIVVVVVVLPFAFVLGNSSVTADVRQTDRS